MDRLQDNPRSIVLIGSNGVGFSTAYLVNKIQDLKVLVVDDEPISVQVANKEFTDTLHNVERGLATDLVKYIESKVEFKNKIFKSGGQCEPILVDNPHGGQLKRFGGSNFTPKKKKRKR
jgi:predicted ABC-type ATPase